MIELNDGKLLINVDESEISKCYGVVYRATKSLNNNSLHNGKYVGRTKNIRRRFKKHLREFKSNKEFHDDLRNHPFVVDIMKYCNSEEYLFDW